MPDDKSLGMSVAIDRRDFLDGVLLAGAGLAIAGAAPAGAPQDQPGYYPPLLTGLRGSHPGSFEAAHAERDGKPQARPAPTGETYDLVVVGAGLSGLAAAWFHRAANPGARILILDNHDDFGGHAKRNEYRLGGRLHLMNGGTMMIDSPRPYAGAAAALLVALGVDPVALTRASMHREVYAGLGSGVFFDAAGYGADRLVAGRPREDDAGSPLAWQAFLAKTPLSPATQAEVLRIETATTDYLPGLDEAAKVDRLSRISYRDYLGQVAGVSEPTLAFYQTRTHGEWACGIDAVSALDAWGFGLPGFAGLGLQPKAHRRMSFTPRGYVEGGSATFHFPDGNASLARLLVRSLVPGAIPGTSATDIVTAACDYARLDAPGNATRIRLSSIVTRVRHLGDPATATAVEVAYVRGGKAQSVRGARVVLACWNAMIPYLAPELPEAQKAALHELVKAPLVYTTVAVRNWQAWHKLGVWEISAPGGYFTRAMLNWPVDIGGYAAERDPAKPILLFLSRTPCQPGLPEHDQNRAGRAELLATPFATFERAIRAQLGAMLGPGGFDPARDITGITVNRWPHGYAPEYNYLWEPDVPDDQRPDVLGRARFGRIAIANSDSGGGAYTDVAINQGARAVAELAKVGSGVSEGTRPLARLFAEQLPQRGLAFLEIAAAGEFFGDDAHRLARGIDDGDIVGAGIVEQLEDGADIGVGRDKGVALDGEAGDRGRGIEVFDKGRGGGDNAGIATLGIGQHDPAGRAERHALAEAADREGADEDHRIEPHQAGGVESLLPADVTRAADRRAAHMQPPRREGITEAFARHRGSDQCRGDNNRRQREIMGRFQDQQRQCHRPTDDRHAERRHADQRGVGDVDMWRDARGVDDFGIKLADKAAHEQRGEEQPAAKAEAQRDHRCRQLEGKHRGEKGDRQVQHEIEVQCAMAGRQRLRRGPGDRNQQQAAERRAPAFADRQPPHHAFAGCHQPHDADADDSADEAEQGKDEIIGGGQRRIADRGDQIGFDAESVGDKGGGQGRSRDRRDRRGRIGADDDFECIEGTGQRRAKGRADGGTGPGADHGAQIAAAQLQPLAEQRGKAAAGLGIGRLQPDRGAAAIRYDRLQRYQGAVDDRNPAAVQGIGLDDVDRHAAALAQQDRYQRQKAAPQRQGEQAPGMMDRPERAQPVDADAVQQLLHAVCQDALHVGKHPGADAGDDGEQDECSLAFAQPLAEPQDQRTDMHGGAIDHGDKRPQCAGQQRPVNRRGLGRNAIFSSHRWQQSLYDSTCSPIRPLLPATRLRLWSRWRAAGRGWCWWWRSS